MGGGLMQLVAYGAQDVYLTGNPQITFWKVVYRRCTNFAVEAIEQVFSGEADFGKRVTCTVSRNGDLINQMFIQVELPALAAGVVTGAPSAAYTDAIGHAMIKSVQVEIGGQPIDKHYGVWLDIWNELTQTSEKWNGYCEMVGKFGNKSDVTKLISKATKSQVYYVPLQFWFNRNPGLAIPLIALQFHEVKINIEFRSKQECIIGIDTGTRATGTMSVSGNIKMTSCSLFIDYVYLDTDERRRFAQESHEYLIDQLQNTGVESIALKENNAINYRMNFNHPVKELVWVLQQDAVAPSGGNPASNDWFNFGTDTVLTNESTANSGDLMSNDRQCANISLNGHERFSLRPASYFRLVEPFKCHTRIPSKPIYVYSFGLRPEDHQPSGTVNMSRIDNANLSLKLTNSSHTSNTVAVFGTGNKSGTLTVFATNYNVLRITSGMGGLAYSN
jgi:hypothetical protein